MYAVLQAKPTQVSPEYVPQANVPVATPLKTSSATPAPKPLAHTVSNKTPDDTHQVETAVPLINTCTADTPMVKSSSATPAVAPNVLSGTTAVPPLATAASDVAPVASSELPFTSKESQPAKQSVSGMAISAKAPAAITPGSGQEVQVRLALHWIRESALDLDVCLQ